MTKFGILHLTDLHYGLDSQEMSFPKVRRNFFDDLSRLHELSKPWDLVIFTGDLVQSGDPEQFKRLDGFLDELREYLSLLGSKPIFLVVPGNHDLARPKKETAAVRILTELANNPKSTKIWDELFNDPDSEYRDVINRAFKPYIEWWNKCPLRPENGKRFSYNEGLMPGDFTAVLEKNGVRLGVLGLNTTFLQLTGENLKEKLAIDARQFHKACEVDGQTSDGERWLEQVDAAILMTHHPPSWLSEQNRSQVYERFINEPGKFAAHFSGHLHLPDAETRSRGFSDSRRLIQGGSLFGLETEAGNPKRLISAYAASEIVIDACQGKIRLFPRKMIEKHGNFFRFERDEKFELIETNGGTRYETFRVQTTDRPPEPPPTPIEDWQPKIPPLQRLDFPALSRRNFVGREELIRDFNNALQGLHFRSDKQEQFRSNREVQLFWLHGFGGMGKSWFLRQACTTAKDSANSVEVALIDWHSPEWHKPASQPPRDPRELFDAIAYRLADLYGIENLKDYWQARKKVEDAWSKHLQLHDSFDESLNFLQIHGENWANEFASLSGSINMQFHCGVDEKELKNHLELCEKILQKKGICFSDPKEFVTKINEIRKNLNKFDVPDDGTTDRLFENWAHELKSPKEDEIIKPCQLLAEALQITIRNLCEKTPLVLVLDTCEMLTQAMDNWLRRLLAPVLDGQTRILILVGSRFKSDAGIMPGQRAGWKEEVDRLRLRAVPFDEDVRFTASEIEQVLQLENIILPSSYELYDLSARLLRVTLGVPLAVGTLLNLHREGDSVLDDLASLDIRAAEELDSSLAVTRVIEVVARRFLLHLENRPELANDFRDVIALALLRKVNSIILSSFWEGNNVRDRLLELMSKYDLLANGDLHDTVRDYLRRFWRQSPPPRVQEIAQQLLDSLQRNKPNETFDSPERIDWEIEQLNLLSWLRGEEAYPQFMRLFVIFLAYDLNTLKLSNLAQEIQPTSSIGRSTRKMLDDKNWNYASRLDNDALKWLEQQRTSDWDSHELVCLDLIIGLNLEQKEKYSDAVRHLEQALDILGENIPQRDKVARAYFKSIYKMGQSAKEIAEGAYQRIVRLQLADPEKWEPDYYWILHNSNRYEEAEAYCLKSIEKEPSNPSPHGFLGHILGKHLNRHTDAISVFRGAIEKHPSNSFLHYVLASFLNEQLNKPDDAEKEYRETLSLTVDIDYKVKILNSLAKLLKQSGNRQEEVKVIYDEILSLKPNDTDTLNSLSWQLYVKNADLNKAERLARCGFDNAPDDINMLHTFAAILVRRDKEKWYEAKPKVQEWLQKVDVEKFKSRWIDHQPMFYDAINNEHSHELVEMLKSLGNDVVWVLLKSVIQKIADNLDEYPNLPPELKDSADELSMQLLSDEKVSSFPDISL